MSNLLPDQIVKVRLDDYAISMEHCNTLAEEFYGKLLSGGDGLFEFGFEPIPGDDYDTVQLAASRAKSYRLTIDDGFRKRGNLSGDHI